MFEISLKGQVCLITGATRGIGKAVALTMAKADLMEIVIVDRRCVFGRSNQRSR